MQPDCSKLSVEPIDPDRAIASVTNPRHETDLVKVRAFLLPALWAIFSNSDITSDIVIDKTGNLIVEASLIGQEDKSLAFCITDKAIQDGLYIGLFAPACEILRKSVLDGVCHGDPKITTVVHASS